MVIVAFISDNQSRKLRCLIIEPGINLSCKLGVCLSLSDVDMCSVNFNQARNWNASSEIKHVVISVINRYVVHKHAGMSENQIGTGEFPAKKT